MLRGDIIIDTEEIQRIMKTYLKKNLYSTKLENLKQIDEILIYITHQIKLLADKKFKQIHKPQ